MKLLRALPRLALVALVSLAFGSVAHAADAPSPAEQGEVVVSVWTYVSPGLPEKRGCRIRVVVDNHTPVPVGFSGKFDSSLKGKVLDAWFVSTSRVPPKGSTDRLYSCVMLPDTLELQGDSPYGYPQLCEVSGQQVAPCPFKVRLVSNVKTLKQP